MQSTGLLRRKTKCQSLASLFPSSVWCIQWGSTIEWEDSTRQSPLTISHFLLSNSTSYFLSFLLFDPQCVVSRSISCHWTGTPLFLCDNFILASFSPPKLYSIISFLKLFLLSRISSKCCQVKKHLNHFVEESLKVATSNLPLHTVALFMNNYNIHIYFYYCWYYFCNNHTTIITIKQLTKCGVSYFILSVFGERVIQRNLFFPCTFLLYTA